MWGLLFQKPEEYSGGIKVSRHLTNQKNQKFKSPKI